MRKVYQYNKDGKLIRTYPSVRKVLKIKRIKRDDLLSVISKKNNILGFYYSYQPPSRMSMNLLIWITSQKEWCFFKDIPKRFAFEKVWEFIESNSHIILNDEYTAFKRVTPKTCGNTHYFKTEQNLKYYRNIRNY